MNVFGFSSALDAGGGTRAGGPLQFPSLYESAVATFFHVNSSLVTGRNGGDHDFFTKPSPHLTNSTRREVTYYASMPLAFDPQEMILRFRHRADAVQKRGMPTVEGPERQRYIEAEKLDFLDYAMLGDAVATLEGGILRLEIDLRPREN